MAESLHTSVSTGRLNARILLAIVAAAVALKLAVFFISIGTSMTFSFPSSESWQDFSLAYVPAVDAFKSGFLPYIGFFYPYPPLFLYALTLFSYLPLPSWSSAIPLVLGDALTVIPVYLIAREVVNERFAVITSLAFLLAPINLFYVDYLWLNPPLTTLFLMVSIYLLIKGRYGWSATSLAAAVCFKQTALIALPILLLVVWRRSNGRREPLRYFAVVALTCFAVSIPYILINPLLYLVLMFRVPPNLWSGALPSSYWTVGVGTGTPITIDTLNPITSRWDAVVQGMINAPVTLGLPFFIFVVPSTLAWVYSSPGYSDFGWVLLLAAFVFLLYKLQKRKGLMEADSIRYIAYGLLLFFALYPAYKYYAVGVVPLFAVLSRSKWDVLAFAIFNVGLILVPRYFASWAILAPLLWLLREDIPWPRLGFRGK